MAYFESEQLLEARKMDLLTYLQTYEPTELVKLRGNVYCTREHDSLKKSNGKWYWWSRGFGGVSALDYLVKVKGKKFTDAVEKILGQGAGKAPIIMSNKKELSSKRLLLPDESPSSNHVIKYLIGRGIDKDLIEACLKRKVIYESLPYHNCVFLGYDEKNVPRYAAYRLTNNMKMIGDVAGSDKRYSFRTSGKGRNLHVFESPIDLLSYMTVMHIQTGRWLPEPMLSLGGVYEPSSDPVRWKIPVALQNMIENHPEVTSISLHLDNDQAGKSAAWTIQQLLKNKFNVEYEPAPRGKDYNDYLRMI